MEHVCCFSLGDKKKKGEWLHVACCMLHVVRSLFFLSYPFFQFSLFLSSPVVGNAFQWSSVACLLLTCEGVKMESDSYLSWLNDEITLPVLDTEKYLERLLRELQQVRACLGQSLVCHAKCVAKAFMFSFLS